MTYHVNSIFHTLQGEGYWVGRPAVFVRFSRCNLWTGHEKDRHRAVCQFCDTDFVDSTTMTAVEIIEKMNSLWPTGQPNKMVVFTGGEPALQLDRNILAATRYSWYRAIETNGTVPFRFNADELDWICVSPKAGTNIVIRAAHELKVVWPQPFEPDWLDIKAEHHWLSPMDGPNLKENTADAVDYVKAHPRWRLTVQTHKYIGID